MSFMASQNTGCKYAPLKNRIGHGLDISCGFVGPRCGRCITDSRMKKEVLKCIKQMLSNALRAKSIVVVGEKGWQVLVRLREGTYQDHRNTSPLHMLSFFDAFCCFSQVLDTDKCHFQLSTKPLWKNFPPRPLHLASFITELVRRHVKLNFCDGFIDLHGRGQGLAE